MTSSPGAASLVRVCVRRLRDGGRERRVAQNGVLEASWRGREGAVM
jgi:hypothetical protein